MYRKLRAFSTLGRSVFRSHPSLSRQDGTFTFRHVRFLKPTSTFRYLRKVVIWAVVFRATWYLFEDDEDEEEEEKDGTVPNRAEETAESVKSAPLPWQETGPGAADDALTNEGREVEDEEDSDEVHIPEELPEDAIFIPLGLARKLPPYLYKGSDPEWASFVEFSNDQKRKKEVHGELAGMIGGMVSQHPFIVQVIGQPVRIGRIWLDTDYPDGPPPEYERRGLEITPQYVALTVRPVDAETVTRVIKGLQPTQLALSFWAYHETLWKFQKKKLMKTFFGSEAEEANKPEASSLESSSPLEVAEDGNDDLKSKTTKDTATKATKATKSSLTTKVEMDRIKSPEATVPEPSSSSIKDSSDSWILRHLPRVQIPRPGLELKAASKAFKRTFAQGYQQIMIPAPRGTVMVSGLIDVLGPDGICIIDVRAAYHPQDAQWVGFNVSVRALKPYTKPPKGDA